MAKELTDEEEGLKDFGHDYDQKYGFRDPETFVYKSPKGLSREIVETISDMKDEPQWMREFRLKAYDHFLARPMPTWGSPLMDEVDFDDIHYFVRASEQAERSWDDVPQAVKETFDRLGIPEAERKFLAGVGAQYDSEVVYHQMQEELEKQGVIFLDMDSGLREHEDIVREYFATIVPANDNKLAALNSAVWSGGSFVYVPPGVHVEMPLQAYFRINTENMGQFERTLIIADKGSSVTYVEGCHLAGARVKTEEGEVAIEDLAVGDKVLTHKGRFRPITKTMSRSVRQDIHSIRLQGEKYRRLQVTPGHPFLAVKRRRFREHNSQFEPQWLEAHQLEKGDYLALPLRSLQIDVAPELSQEVLFRRQSETVSLPLDPDTCRLIGLYLAEGSVSKNTSFVSFHTHEDETHLHEFITKTMSKLFALTPYQTTYRDRAGLSLVYGSVRAARWFAQSFGRITEELRIPQYLFSLPEESRAALVRGLWDGEGHLAEKERLYRINQTNQDVAQGIRELLLSLGIRSSLSRTDRAKPRRPIWQVAVCKADNYKFEEMVLLEEANSFRASHAGAVIDGKYLWMPILSIEKNLTSAKVYNLSVADDESYIADGVVSHNCTAPTYSSGSLHSAVVELIAKPGASIRYTTVQNWSHNVFNLVTKRAVAEREAKVEWVDANLGSLLTTKYPSVYLTGERAHGEILSIAFAGKGQHQDAGGKIIHAAPNTTSNIFAKSISKDGGRSTYRGLLEVAKGATNAKSKVVCDALLLDEESRTDTYPTIRISEDRVDIGHEATVSKVGEEQLFYLMAHGIDEEEAAKMIVNGFIEPVVKELPMEYAVEMNRLIELQMEGSIG